MKNYFIHKYIKYYFIPYCNNNVFVESLSFLVTRTRPFYIGKGWERLHLLILTLLYVVRNAHPLLVVLLMVMDNAETAVTIV